MPPCASAWEEVKTWVKSQWKNPRPPGQISVEINNVAPHTDDRSSFPTSSGRHGPRLALVRASYRVPSRACALVSATILGLHALPAAAAGLDPAKVNADPTAQRTLEAIDAAHHLQPLGTLAHYVLAADAQGQTCTLTDKGNDIFMLECEPAPQHPAYSLLLTGENGRLLVVSMYGADSHLLPTGDAFERLIAVAPVQPEATTPPRSALADDGDLLLSAVAPQGSTFWAYERDGRKMSLGTVAELSAAIERRGGTCTIAQIRIEAGAGNITCRSPGARGDQDAEELQLEVKYGTTDCLAGQHCYEVRDIKLNDRRLTHAQFLQHVARAAATFPAPAAPASKAASSDRCLWTSVQGQKADMGSLARLDAFTHQIGGQCYIGTGAEDHATITCRFPDSRTHRSHELVLEGDGDGADCFGITHTALDGRTLPYAQYVRVFIDHK